MQFSDSGDLRLGLDFAIFLPRDNHLLKPSRYNR